MSPFKNLLVGGGLLIAGMSMSAVSAANTPITIGTNNWAENIAISHMWQQLLGEKGFDVSLSEVSKPILFGGLAAGDIDISLEVWLPSDNSFIEPYSDRIDLHGTWYDDALDALVVPSYVDDINSVADLERHAEDFEYQGEPTIFGIEPGSTIADETDAAIEQYQLPFRQLSSSESAMMAQLKEAYREKQPVAVTLWQPHWAFAEYDLKILDDPKKTFSAGEQIKWVSHHGFGDDNPGLKAMLDAWHMTPEQLSQLMLEIENTGDPDKGAAQWIAANRDLVDGWLAARP
ncbi:glycine betaine ABC transporter substrate-binding protein [Salinicola corii]|uniref:Glycine betaine ABC transporter substrate-binding protein n=1 Tax=Salinicola corii TaxID=2606937 RepID=A0A640WDW1_9GAMM|nr:glycine betaine ABC transporter substrate-binding protein [Salinicola corii]KAA0018172.1 glycine betaine ABC transporter substrate-binding protein [Salinicola corii]